MENCLTTTDFDPDCHRCDAGGHVCPGCGKDVRHDEIACRACCDGQRLMSNESWTIGGMRPDERIMGQIERYRGNWIPAPHCTLQHPYGEEGWRPGGGDYHDHFSLPPSREQVAAVLHALADHTALEQAVQWREDPDGDIASSVGRWLHDLGDYLEDR